MPRPHFGLLWSGTLHVDCDLLREVAARDGLRYGCDRAHLVGEIHGHRVDVVDEDLVVCTN